MNPGGAETPLPFGDKHMKKLIGLAAVLALVVGFAVSAATVTNRGEVITITTYDDMVTATQDTNVMTLATGPWVTILVNDTAFTATDATAYTPDGPGQLLLSYNSATATGFVYIADGWSTNDWTLLK